VVARRSATRAGSGPILRDMQRTLGTLILAFVAAACGADTRIAPAWPGSYLVVGESGALAVIEPNGGAVHDRFEGPTDPRDVAVSGDGRFAAVLGADGALAVVDLHERRTETRFHVAGAGPASGLVYADRRSTLVVAFEGSGELALVTRGGGSPEGTIATGGRGVIDLARAPDGRRVAALTGMADGTDWIEFDAPTLRGGSDSAHTLDAIAPGSDRGEMWCHAQSESAVRYTAGAGKAEIALELGEPPFAIAAVPGARRAVVSSARSGELVIVDGAARAITARVAVGRADPAATRGWAVLVDPDSRQAFVAIPGEARVVVVDLATFAVRGEYATGPRPSALAWTVQRSGPGSGLGVGH